MKTLTLLMLFGVVVLSGCAPTTSKMTDVVGSASVAKKSVIIVTPPFQPGTVTKDLWQRAMAEFGLEETMTEYVSQNIDMRILSESAVSAVSNDNQKIQAKQIALFKEGYSRQPKAIKQMQTLLGQELSKYPELKSKVDYVLVGWVSKFSVIGTTRSFAGPLSSQARDCTIISGVGLYDVKTGMLYLNQGEIAYKVKSLGLIVTPSSVITDFDLSVATRASQDAMNKGLSNIFGQ